MKDSKHAENGIDGSDSQQSARCRKCAKGKELENLKLKIVGWKKCDLFIAATLFFSFRNPINHLMFN